MPSVLCAPLGLCSGMWWWKVLFPVVPSGFCSQSYYPSLPYRQVRSGEAL